MKKMCFSLSCIGIALFMYSCNSSGNTGNDNSGSAQTAEASVVKENIPATEVETSNPIDQEIAATGGDVTEPFDYLEKMTLSKKYGIFIKFNEAFTEVFNKQLGDLDESDPLYTMGEGSYDIKVLKTKINSGGDYYYVVFSFGPSGDPSFIFYKDGAFENPVYYVFGLHLFIPGNGNIYVSGHTNNLFDTRKKIELKGNEFIEVKQPYYYVGLKSKTIGDISIYDSQDLTNVIASLPKGYSVEVLINQPGTDLFLVKTDFGMTGWLKLGDHAFRGNELIEGLFYDGD